MINIKEIYRQPEDNYSYVGMDILCDDTIIGRMSLMVDEKSCYLERIDIDEDKQGKGYGTSAMRQLTQLYDTVYAAPNNPDSQRLFMRIGEPYDADEADYVDQGYGVYRI